MKIGFIGLGNVGGKLAGSLLRNGFDLTVRDLNQEISRPFLDNEIDYSLWDETPSGSNFVKPHGQVIDNQPVLEPNINTGEGMVTFLFKSEFPLTDN